MLLIDAILKSPGEPNIYVTYRDTYFLKFLLIWVPQAVMAIVKGTLWTTIPKGHWQNG